MPYKFSKMNGAGNDFIIFDTRKQHINLSPEQIRALSARDNKATGGCDQLLVLRPTPDADIFMQIYNADGGEVDACGNATRCVADILHQELGKLPVTIKTNAAVLQGIGKEKIEGAEEILVDMGKPGFEWQDIPLALPVSQAAQRVAEFCGLENPVFVSMGNPHVVFFLDFDSSDKANVEAAAIELLDNMDIAALGAKLEQYKEIFPQRVNVSIAILSKLYPEYYSIHAKVWERGAGLTQACGTAACAMLAAANRMDKNIGTAIIHFENFKDERNQPRQLLYASMNKNGHILLGGKIEKEFEGEIQV